MLVWLCLERIANDLHILVSQYQKGRTILDFNEARDDGGISWTTTQVVLEKRPLNDSTAATTATTILWPPGLCLGLPG